MTQAATSLANLSAGQTPAIQERRRRESSFTQSLDDPLRYMDLVKRTLGSQYEEVEDRKQKETKTTLENIDEETVASRIDPSEVDFIKKQFSNFSFNDNPTEE